MRLWQRVILSTDGALRDIREHLGELAANEDRLSKADTLEKLHYQRGKLDGINAVLFLLKEET